MKKSEIIADVLIKVLAILIILYFILLGIKGNISNSSNESYENIEKDIESENIETSEKDLKSMKEVESTTSEVEEETFGTLDKLTFIIDVTLVDNSNNTFKGNTSTDNGYSGIIEFKLSDNALENICIEIEQGNTYVVEASPMIETGTDDLPLITVTNLSLATEDDINKLEEIRGTVSTFKRKLIEYNSMSLEEIINDANTSYATWTQDEIKEYIKLIEDKGYTDKTKEKSYVCLRESISEVYSE